MQQGWLLYEHGAGSGERGFLISIFKNSNNHGEGDLLPALSIVTL
jgi:hypothetical protein